jgi:hypothetical protein
VVVCCSIAGAWDMKSYAQHLRRLQMSRVPLCPVGVDFTFSSLKNWCDRAGLGFALNGLKGYKVSVGATTAANPVSPLPYVN